MRNRQKTVDMNGFLADDRLSHADRATAALELLRGHPEFAQAYDGRLLRELEYGITIMAHDNCAWIDMCLGLVYDIADREKIWMGV